MDVKVSHSLSPGPHLTFPQALVAVIKRSAEITKLEWDNNTVYGTLRNGILMLHRDGEWFQWIINEGDLLGTDWIIR